MTAYASSLRTRLLAAALTAVAGIWLAAAGLAWYETRRETEAVFDAHLAETATLLQAYAGEEPDEIGEHLPLQRYARRIVFQFRDADGLLIARSSDAPAELLSDRTEGFTDSKAGGHQWRVFARPHAETGIVVLVAELQAARDQVANEVARHLLTPLAVALPALALALALFIGRGLRPLQQLAQEVARRHAEDLGPLPAQGQPKELQPLVERLNQLFGRVGRSLDQERRFTADAAHELRTPLAAIRAHAQVATAETDVQARRQALDGVIAATDRATRLTEQLLTLARLDAETGVLSARTCELREIATGVLADLAPAALARSVQLELADGPPAVVTGEATLLAILLRNLVDNAVHHSPPQGVVRVVTLPADASAGPTWHVIDQGPGIAADARALVLERFRRLPGAPEGGAGLGLSIVQRIAQLHGATLRMAEGPNAVGLDVGVGFANPNTGAESTFSASTHHQTKPTDASRP